MAETEVKPKRRFVSNEEFEEALANQDFLRLIKHVTGKYSKVLSRDERERAGMMALWRMLGYHVDGAGKKKTTNLYWFLHKECCRAIRDRRAVGRSEATMGDAQYGVLEGDEVRSRTRSDPAVASFLGEAMEKALNRLERRVVRLHYFDGLSVTEVAGRLGLEPDEASYVLRRSWRKLRRVMSGATAPGERACP